MEGKTAFARERVKMTGDHRIFLVWLARKPSIPSTITVEGSLSTEKAGSGQSVLRKTEAGSRKP